MSSSSPVSAAPYVARAVGQRLRAQDWNDAVQQAQEHTRTHAHAPGSLDGQAIDPQAQLRSPEVRTETLNLNGKPLEQALTQAGAAAARAQALTELLGQTGGQVKGDLSVQGGLAVAGDVQLPGALQTPLGSLPFSGPARGVRFYCDEGFDERRVKQGEALGPSGPSDPPPWVWVPAGVALTTTTFSLLWIVLHGSLQVGVWELNTDWNKECTLELLLALEGPTGRWPLVCRPGYWDLVGGATPERTPPEPHTLRAPSALLGAQSAFCFRELCALPPGTWKVSAWVKAQESARPLVFSRLYAITLPA